MESSHDNDPKGTVDPWDAFQTSLSAVKDHLKESYHAASDGHGPSEDEVKAAFATLGAMWGQIADSVGAALRDPVTREQLKDTAASLASALGATLSQLGDAIDESEEEEE